MAADAKACISYGQYTAASFYPLPAIYYSNGPIGKYCLIYCKGIISIIIKDLQALPVIIRPAAQSVSQRPHPRFKETPDGYNLPWRRGAGHGPEAPSKLG